MTMMEDFNQYIPNEGISLGSPTRPTRTLPTTAGEVSGVPLNLFGSFNSSQRLQTDPVSPPFSIRPAQFDNEKGYWDAAGEMLQERMADRQAGPLMPGGEAYITGELVSLANQLGIDPRFGVTSPMGTGWDWTSPEAASSMINFPSIASQTDMQDITRRGGSPDFADFARTTTMGTGYQPSVYEPIQRVGTPIGSMGIQNQPMVAPVVDPVVAPVFDPSSFANTLLPPANEEMLYGNRQDWTGPLVDPFMNPWTLGAQNPNSIQYNLSHPNWYDASRYLAQQRLNDAINFGQEYGAYALNPMAYLTNNLFDRFIR
tara:strand:- start:794 stop:1738 length:945 start_codon:yes stop_codon:yes gene_type:complete